jgi:hypothetical protein
MALILFKDYWWKKLKGYYNDGILVASGIQCPQCTLELYTTAPIPLSSAVSKDGQTVIREIPTWPAVCKNGHQVRL